MESQESSCNCNAIHDEPHWPSCPIAWTSCTCQSEPTGQHDHYCPMSVFNEANKKDGITYSFGNTGGVVDTYQPGKIDSIVLGFDAGSRIIQAKAAVKDFLANNLGPATAQPTQYMKEQQAMTSTTNDYKSLSDVLERAYQQAAHGKGKERHAQDLPFTEQPMQTISQLVGSSDGLRYQAIKKIQEAGRMDKDAAVRELLGAINYIAGTIIYMESGNPADVSTPPTSEDLLVKYRGQWIRRFSGVWSLLDKEAGTRLFPVNVQYNDGSQKRFETFNDVGWYGSKDIHAFQVL